MSGDPQVEVLESRPTALGRLRDRWSGWPWWLQTLVAATTVVAVGIPAGAVGRSQVDEWLAERRLANTVELQATLRVSSSSSTPVGGRVDYYVTIRNAGPRQIRVSGLRIVEAGLRITSRRIPSPEVVRPGRTLYLPLSVRLDCRRPAETRDPGILRGEVAVLPANGRWRRVSTPFDRASPLIDVAATLCGLDPALHGKQLSGPVL